MSTTKPTVEALDSRLRDVKNWKKFAVHLPGISQNQIAVIPLSYRDDVEKQKTALYDKWLKVYPNASWDDVIKALWLADGDPEKAIAKQLREGHTTVDSFPEAARPKNKAPALKKDKSQPHMLIIDRVFQLLHHRSSGWHEIARELGISFTYRRGLLRNLSLDDDGKLECIIEEWFESEPTPTTWESLVSALKKLGYHDVIQNIIASGDFDGMSPILRDTVPETSEVTMTVKKRKDYALHLKRAAAEGTVTTRISSLGILGAAGTGKTSIKKLLTNQKPDDVHNSTAALQSEKYVKVDSQASEDGSTHSSLPIDLVKPVLRNKVIASAETWRLATQETLIERIANCVEMAKQHEESSSNANVNAGLAGFAMKKKDDPTKIPHTIDINKSGITNDSIDAPSASTLDQVALSEYDEIAQRIIDRVTSKILLGITHFVSISDTGGQAAFMDIAPFLLNFNSVNLILLKLNEKLENPAQFFYSINGVKVGDETRQISTKSLVHSFVSSKSKIKKPRIEGIKVAKPHQKPMFMILGTHFDVYKKEKAAFETIEKKNQLLESDLSNFEDCIYTNGDGEVIYKALDARARDDDTFKLASDIQEFVMENYIEAEIPVAWYILELAMDKVAADNNESLIFLPTLAKIGTAISKMPREEVEAALVYFHNLQVCLFYPDVVPNVVFTNPQYLFDRISGIIAFSYNKDAYRGVTKALAHDTLRKYGKFKIGLLDIVFRDKPFHEDFSQKDFLALLDHLFIVCSLQCPNTSTAYDKMEYFMPCVLDEHQNPCKDFVSPSLQVEPLLLTWLPNNSVPNGLFPSLTTNIQADSGFNGIHFTMPIAEKDEEPILQYRNRITLYCQKLACEVVLIECDTFVGIAVHSKSLQKRPNTCVDIRKAVFACMESIVDRFKDRWPLSFALPDEVFICKVRPECRDRLADPPSIHFCSPTTPPIDLACGKKSIETMDLKPSYTIWWGGTGSALIPSLDHSIELAPLNLFRLLSDKSSKWDDIGRELDISSNYRDSLKQDSSSNNHRLEAVLEEWVQKKTPKWSDFIDVLKNRLQFYDVAQQTLTFISTHCT